VLEDEAWHALSDHNPVVATFALGERQGSAGDIKGTLA
jgi:hypothetical protein